MHACNERHSDQHAAGPLGGRGKKGREREGGGERERGSQPNASDKSDKLVWHNEDTEANEDKGDLTRLKRLATSANALTKVHSVLYYGERVSLACGKHL